MFHAFIHTTSDIGSKFLFKTFDFSICESPCIETNLEPTKLRGQFEFDQKLTVLVKYIVPSMIHDSSLLIKKVFGRAVAVAFQSVFRAEIH